MRKSLAIPSLSGMGIPRIALHLLLLIAWAVVTINAALFLKDRLMLDSQQIGRKIILIPVIIMLLMAAVGAITIPYRKNPRTARYWLVAILILAAVLRLSWALAFPTTPISDFELNHSLAIDLSEDRVSTSFSRNIGYPAVLSLVYRIYPDPLSGRMLNVVFGVLSVYLVYLLAALAVDPLAGLLSALFMAISAPEVMMSSVLCTEIGTLTLLLGCVLGLLKVQQNPLKLWWTVLIGTGLAVALLFRPVAIVYLPIFLAGLWVANRQRQTNFWKHLLIFLGCMVAVPVLVAAWHSLSIKTFSLKSLDLGVGSYTLLSGTNIEGNGYFNDADAELYWSWPEAERTQRSMALAYNRIADDPGRFVGFVGLKMKHLLANDTYGLAWSLYPLETEWTALQLELINLRLAVVAQTMYVIMLLAGFFYFLRVSFAKPWLPFIISSALVLSVMPFILTESQPRYHHLMLGFIALAAGCGIYEGLRTFSKKNGTLNDKSFQARRI